MVMVYVDGITLQARMFDQFGNLVDGELPEDMVEKAEAIHLNLSEIVAETDNELMEKFFGGERFTREEIIKGLKGSSYWSNEDLFDEGQPPIDRMFASVDYLIQEFMPNDLQNQTNSWSGSFISNSNIGYDSVFVQSADFNVDFSNNFETEVLDGEWLLEDIQNTDGFFDFFYKNANSIPKR